MLPLYISNLAGYGRTNRIPLYVEEVAEKHPEKRFHSHTFSELVLVLRGEALHLVGEESFEVRRGDLLVLHPGAVHGYDKTGNFGIINLTYDYHKLSMPILDGYELPLFRRFFPSAGTVPSGGGSAGREDRRVRRGNPGAGAGTEQHESGELLSEHGDVHVGYGGDCALGS